MDQRKRKRMQSNRESARRSRMRKQKHLDDLMAQVVQLRKENNEILSSITTTNQRYLTVEADNSILRAQAVELTQRYQSVNAILNISHNNGLFQTDQDFHSMTTVDPFINSMNNYLYHNHPIMASSADIFPYGSSSSSCWCWILKMTSSILFVFVPLLVVFVQGLTQWRRENGFFFFFSFLLLFILV